MNDNVDYILLNDLIEYNKYRRYCFINNIEFEPDINLERKLKARYMKVSRIKKRLIYLLTRYDFIYFVTFTFDDQLINRCDRTKRDLIKSSLLSFDSNIKFILNVDYGKKTEREHYHCIVATNNNFSLSIHLKNTYPCFTKTELCNKKSSDLKRLSKYINKLTNHALKDSTKNKRIYFNFKGYDNLDSFLSKVVQVNDKVKLFLD